MKEEREMKGGEIGEDDIGQGKEIEGDRAKCDLSEEEQAYAIGVRDNGYSTYSTRVEAE